MGISIKTRERQHQASTPHESETRGDKRQIEKEKRMNMRAW